MASSTRSVFIYVLLPSDIIAGISGIQKNLERVEPIESIEPVANLFAICCNLNGRGPGKLFQAAVDCGQWTF